MKINITALVALNGGEETCVSIELSDGIHTEVQKHSILTSQYAELRVKKEEINIERYEEIVRAASICSAYKKGLSLLSYSDSSKKNLHYKLRSRGFEDAICDEAIEMLSHKGYIDEDYSCVREAERCIKKLWGKKRIAAHLYSKGFDESSVRDALEQLSEVDYTENCKKLITRDHKRQLAAAREDKAQMKKLVASIERMGYSFSEIKNALGDVLD